MSNPQNPNQRGQENDPSRQGGSSIQGQNNLPGKAGEAGRSGDAGRPGKSGQDRDETVEDTGGPRKDQPIQRDRGRKEGWVGDNPTKDDEPVAKKYVGGMSRKPEKTDHEENNSSYRRY